MSTQTVEAPERIDSAVYWSGAAAGLFVGGALLLAYTDLPGPVCISRVVFDFPCPGCGLTRSLLAICRGDAGGSFRFHPLGPLLFLGAVLLIARMATPPAHQHRWKAVGRAGDLIGQSRGMIGLAALLICLWLIRLALDTAGVTFFRW